MKKLYHALVLAAPFIASVQAMQTPAQKAQGIMKEVYESYTKNLNEGTFSENDLAAYRRFPTQSDREAATTGELKPGHVTEGLKIQGLVDYFNGEFGVKAVQIIKELQAQVDKDPASATSQKLQQGLALTTLINLMIEENENRVKPLLIKADVKNLGHLAATFKNILTQRTATPQKAPEAQRAGAVALAQPQTKALAEQTAAEGAQKVAAGKAAGIQRAIARMQTPQGQEVVALMRAQLELLQAKIVNNTVNMDDYIAFTKEFSASEAQPGDHIIREHALVDFFNQGFANDIIQIGQRLLAQPNIATEQNRLIGILGLLIDHAVAAHFEYGFSLNQIANLRTIKKQAETKSSSIW